MKILPEISRTLSEYLLIPGLTTEDCTPDTVDLGTALVRHRIGEESGVRIATPLVSAIMQAVSSPELAVALAQVGGLAFIHQNQPVEEQAADVRAVKRHKAGFRTIEVTVGPDTPLGEVARQLSATEQGVAVVTRSGDTEGAFLGIISLDDFHLERHGAHESAGSRMRGRAGLVTAPVTASLSEANELIWEHHLDVLPVLDGDRVASLVLKRDYQAHKTYHRASVDGEKRLRVGAGINSRDFKDRVPALVEAGADVLCLDSSDGYSVYQAKTLEFVRETYGDAVSVGAGNVVDGRAFRYLADAGAAFVKVGIGGGAICTTRAQKGIGRGQASALLDVVEARDAYARETGVHVPLCCDGGLLNDSHMAMALAMGADFIMLGRYFARLDESPSPKVQIDGQWYKEYWGEGSQRAQNAARYGQGGRMVFEEGVDGFVPYAGSLYDNVERTRAKLTSTMISCGSTNLRDFHRDAVLVPVSAESFKQTGAEVQLRRPTADH
ncbi:inosine 5-monophosphate dehydrogenase [Streptomyces spiroverticillatus]|uniref:Inosine 5-monophosphate dehydrogenase n=1 Tax=Streptomyces finlayi TaxID=67296 RepID=A0A919CBN0_9ACTN|nr:IMP dehydrogenase [Streptomyces finlayi]GHA17891.1 inosine 5-monophosphate dehydrogenase [Streptomyces spiroverticillatus]GHC99635.1 inosine 5-monophosphate dehydrogenase [Streptomyces finlayi]